MFSVKLLAKITQAFEDEPYPGDFNLVDNNEPDYDLESLQIRESFKVHTWQTIPDDLLFYERSALSFLSDKGFKYYLPAFMQFAVREYTESDTIPDDLISDMTLPTEVDIMRLALWAKTSSLWIYPVVSAATSEYNYFQRRLQDLNQAVHRFIGRWHQFSPAQGRAILHFLEHLRDEHGQDYISNQPARAIERYWFQFA